MTTDCLLKEVPLPLHDHQVREGGLVPGPNREIDVYPLDEPPPGRPHAVYSSFARGRPLGTVTFHDPHRDPGGGVNGLTDEAVLAMVADRLMAAAGGAFATSALDHVRGALAALHAAAFARANHGPPAAGDE